jgi:hypothetical protein
MADTRRFVRDNLVFIAAFALPGAVAALFVLASAIPRWTVPPPQHDLLLRMAKYEPRPTPLHLDFVVQDGRLEVVARTVPQPANPAVSVPYVERWLLLQLDHRSMQVREIPFELPQSLAEGESRTVVIGALAGRRVVAGDTAPDGYQVSSLNSGGGGSGIVGDIFGMNRSYRRGVAIAKDGRTIRLELPPPHRDSYESIVTVGWVVDGR